MKTIDFPVTFGEWLKCQRKVLDLTQDELAHRAGCSVFTLRKIESGERRPSKQLAVLLADSLEIPSEKRQVFLRVSRGELNLDKLGLPANQVLAGVTPQTQKSKAAIPLPAPPTVLIGREIELSSLARIFQEPSCRLLTITGPGGIGKTRLVIEFARSQRPHFQGGVFYVSLVALESASLMVSALAEAIGLTLSGQADPKEQLFGFLRQNFNQSVVLVLDNFEHLLSRIDAPEDEPAAVSLVAEILERLPAVKLLVTSRERLQLHGEWTYELFSLPFPPDEIHHNLETFGSVQLFLQGARRIKTDFTATPDDLTSIGQICRFVEGIPLAIELASAWVGVLTCGEIAREIKMNLDILATHMRDLPPRHRSLRATFDHSWELLSNDERAVMQRLAVFRNGFTRDAAEKVAGATLPLLASLVAKSLVRKGEQGRYELHEMTRQYAYAHLMDHAGQEGTHADHARYYLTLLASLEEDLKNTNQQSAMRVLNTEFENIRSAWAWGIQNNQTTLTGRAVRSYGRFFEAAGVLQEGIDQLELLIKNLRGKTENAAESAALAQALTDQGLLYFRKGDFKIALQLLDECLEIHKHLDPGQLPPDPYIYRGVITHLDGDIDKARDLIRMGLDRARAMQDRWFEAYAVYNLGYLDGLSGHLQEGHVKILAGLKIFREIADPHSVALGLNFISPILVKMGRFEEAKKNLEESVSICEQTGDRWGAGTAYRFLGFTCMALGDLTTAQAMIEKSLHIFSGYIGGWDVALSLIFLGEVKLLAEDLAAAGNLFRDALITARKANSLPLQLYALINLASIHARAGECELAYLIAALVHHHPFSSLDSKETAARLLIEMENRLPASQREETRRKAGEVDLPVLVEEILQQF